MDLIINATWPPALLATAWGLMIVVGRYRSRHRDPHRISPGVGCEWQAVDAVRRGRALLDEGDLAWRSRAHTHFSEAVTWLQSEYNQVKWEQGRRPRRRRGRRLARLEALLNEAVLGQRQSRATARA